MTYVGMDIHRRTTTFCFYRPNACLERRYRTLTCATTAEAYRAALRPLGRNCRVAFEVMTGAQWVAAVVRPWAKEVVVVNASRMPWLFRDKTKTDRRDARKLAIALAMGQAPAVYLPPPEVSSWRGLIHYRRGLVSRRTAVKNGVRAIVRSGPWRCPHRSPFSRAGRLWLAELPLDRPTRLRLDGLLQDLRLQEDRLAAVQEELDRLAKGCPEVSLLQSIPGVGPRTAEAIVAFGWQVERFANRKHFASYFGMTPRQDQSGLLDRRGRIHKGGPSVVRWLVVEAAWQALRHNSALRRFFERVHRGRRDRFKKALVALGRKLLAICFAMLRDRRPWDASRLEAAGA